MGAGRIVSAGVVTLATLVVLVPAAQGRTIGSAALPAGSSPMGCSGSPTDVFWQAAGASPNYTAASGGSLVSWSTNVTSVPGGTSVKLVVLRHGAGTRTIVAVETGTVPAVPPPGNVAVFTPAAPIELQPGDQLALGGAGGGICFFLGGTIGADQMLAGGPAAPGLTAGATVTPSGGTSPGGYQLNVAAEVLESIDVRVAASAGPANAVAGGLAQLSATVTNAGQGTLPSVTFAGTLPAGLKIESAVAGGGSCAVTGQQVTCTMRDLAPGAAAPVVVLVTPAAAGTYATSFAGTGQGGLDELTPADNAATATLAVAAAPSATPAPAPKCIVPALSRTPLKVARKLLVQLRCKAGKVTKARSKRIPKGAVIKTKPGRGEYAAGNKVKLVVSAGKPKKQRR